MTGETPESAPKQPHLAAIEHIAEAHSILKGLREPDWKSIRNWSKPSKNWSWH